MIVEFGVFVKTRFVKLPFMKVSFQSTCFAVIALVATTACSSTQLTPSTEKKPSTSLNAFLKAFEKAVIEHNKENVLTLLDSAYVADQHDGMLEGRTDQFLSELFCGYEIESKAWRCPRFQSITEIKRLRIESVNEDDYRVYFIITDGIGGIKVDLFIKSYEKNHAKTFGLIGAVG